MTKVRTMLAMGTMTVSERLRTMLKMPLFHAEGVMPTSPAISPTLVFRVSNIPVRFEMIPSMSSSWNHSCIASKINGDHLLCGRPRVPGPPAGVMGSHQAESRPDSRGIRVRPMSATPPPAISCLIP